jgi:4-hydroxy-2-oxoheptanedioate aldolase
MSAKTVSHAAWLSTPNQAMVEIAHDLGYRRFVLDLEHGLFDDARTDTVIALMLTLGSEVYAKVLGPDPIAIQRPLDMGVTGVIIPHIEGVDHAARVTATAKYPPLGTRSFSGTRPSRYGGAGAEHYIEANEKTKCFPMIETAAALADVDAILALPTVDGLFPGPSDLALSRGRGSYANTEADKQDLRRMAEAANTAGKPWIMPAWSKVERDEAQALGAAFLVVVDEYGSLYEGLAAPLSA